MKTARKVFLVSALGFFIVTVAGIVAMTLMEHNARMALPSEQQTPEAIERLYDGAVCLACDLWRIFIAMFGSIVVIGTLLLWGLSEIGRRIYLSKVANPSIDTR